MLPWCAEGMRWELWSELPRGVWLEAHSQKVYPFSPWSGAGPLTLGRSSQRWDVGWLWCLKCIRVLSPASAWFTATHHSCLGPFILFYFYKSPLLPRGLYDEVNLSCAYLEPVSRRKKCQLLVFKNRSREHAFFCVVFFFPPPCWLPGGTHRWEENQNTISD